MKKVKYIILAIILIVSILIMKTCLFDKPVQSTDKTSDKAKDQQQIAQEIIKSSDIYLNGTWKMKYSDLVYYANDEKGKPELDLTNQPSYYTFNQVGEGLILEEEYPVIEKEYSGKVFFIKVDLKIVKMCINGELKDKNTWVGTFEYLGDGDKILSKCSVMAKRD